MQTGIMVFLSNSIPCIFIIIIITLHNYNVPSTGRHVSFASSVAPFLYNKLSTLVSLCTKRMYLNVRNEERQNVKVSISALSSRQLRSALCRVEERCWSAKFPCDGADKLAACRRIWGAMMMTHDDSGKIAQRHRRPSHGRSLLKLH